MPDKIVTVYSPKGASEEHTYANATDLVRHNGFSWNMGPKTETAPAPEPEPEPEPAPEPTPEPVVEETKAVTLDHDKDPLDVIAKQVNDSDVRTYLEGFTVDALKDMAEKRYGERLRKNVTKDTAIENIITFEDAKIDAEG